MQWLTLSAFEQVVAKAAKAGAKTTVKKTIAKKVTATAKKVQSVCSLGLEVKVQLGLCAKCPTSSAIWQTCVNCILKVHKSRCMSLCAGGGS